MVRGLSKEELAKDQKLMFARAQIGDLVDVLDGHHSPKDKYKLVTGKDEALGILHVIAITRGNTVRMIQGHSVIPETVAIDRLLNLMPTG